MNPSVIDAIISHSKERPDAVALAGECYVLSYRELAEAIEFFSKQMLAAPANRPLQNVMSAAETRNKGAKKRSLHAVNEHFEPLFDTVSASAIVFQRPARALALALDNSPLWAVLDLAALQADIPLVPLPFFFSPGQITHSILDAGIDCILTDQPEHYHKILAAEGIGIAATLTHTFKHQTFSEIRLTGVASRNLPAGTVKITYTSGTTGHPKGVCLGAAALMDVASSLLSATRGTADDIHVSVLPLPTLLENLAGVYVPLLAGATCHLLPLAEVGLSGSSGLDIKKMLAKLAECRASTTILTPQLLHTMTAAIGAGYPAPQQLRFVAVGGAPVSTRLLQSAQRLGIPVFEGYGLSECASVVALNTESERCVGSAGKPLAHVQIKFAADGEILVAGATLLGYAADVPFQQGEFWPTGDTGHLDEQGFLHLSGRKKNIFITSFGRNVSPEWVESELTLHPVIAQAVVFGESRPWNVAVIVPRGSVAQTLIDQAIAETNIVLPDYARIKYWLPAKEPFLVQNGQLTANGRLKRMAIWQIYQTLIEQLYKEKSDDKINISASGDST